jgi:hypothetical protein
VHSFDHARLRKCTSTATRSRCLSFVKLPNRFARPIHTQWPGPPTSSNMASFATASSRNPRAALRHGGYCQCLFAAPTTAAAPARTPGGATAHLALPRQQASPHQVRHAAYVKRPSRPYHFTQLVQLSDGSTYTMRTTSPAALYKAQKDTRNHMLWQPSDPSLRNVEVDEAGRLAAFRERFGSAFDAQGAPAAAVAPGRSGSVDDVAAEIAKGASSSSSSPSSGQETEGRKARGDKTDELSATRSEPTENVAPEMAPVEDSLSDLISGYARRDDQKNLQGGREAKNQAKMDKKK